MVVDQQPGLPLGDLVLMLLAALLAAQGWGLLQLVGLRVGLARIEGRLAALETPGATAARTAAPEKSGERRKEVA